MPQESMPKKSMLRCFSWYGDQLIPFGFPSDWEIRVVGFADLPSLDDQEIRERLHTPIGTPPLAVMARGRRDAVIIVDDLSRPTPAHRLLPMILEELNEGGMDDDDILIVVGSGGHVPIPRGEVVKKVSEEVARRVEMICHTVDDEMAYLGRSSFGTPILINRYVTAYIFTVKGAWPLWGQDLKEDVVRILIAACPEGSGYHRLYTVHRMVRKPRPDLWAARPILYSPVAQPKEAYKVYPDGVFFRSWEDLIGKVVAKFGNRDVKVAVYACPALQFPKA